MRIGYRAIANILDGAWIEKYGIRYWDGKVHLPIEKYYKISVCTVCMNRLVQLKQTILHNIEICKEYPNFEVILLNYNSKDRLDRWVKKNLMKYIKSGELIYYKTSEPEYFNNCHSRNIVWKLASGDIITNIDADYIIEKGYLNRINVAVIHCPEKTVFVRGKSTIRGRIAFYKREFMELGGFDEALTGYAPWDRDIFNRALASGFQFATLGRQYGSSDLGMLKDNDSYSHPSRDENYAFDNWKDSMKLNRVISASNILLKRFEANAGRHWGKANLIKNFKKEISI